MTRNIEEHVKSNQPDSSWSGFERNIKVAAGPVESISEENKSNILSRVFYLLILVVLFLFSSCKSKPGNDVTSVDTIPILFPDYTGITIPPNIAPLNFRIKENAKSFYVKISAGDRPGINISSRTGIIQIPLRKWRRLISESGGKDLKIKIYIRENSGKWSEFRTIKDRIAPEPVDKYLYYRTIYPGFESWADLSITCRDLEDFTVQPLIENSIANGNCVNCHSFNNGKSDDFLFHMRGSRGGTYFYSKGIFRKINLKTKEMKNGAVYPRWHPSGKFVAFSENKIIQRFHASGSKKVEVSDLESSLILYDVALNEMSDIKFSGDNRFMDTYPEWSPDGKYLYFCRAQGIGQQYDYKQIKYSLYRVPFDPVRKSIGETELVYNAADANKSVSFPRISPNGKFLVFTGTDYGCFPVWHKEADLYSINLDTKEVALLDLNSEFTESYHSWSSNGRWLIFSSKRLDGLTSVPFMAYVNNDGKTGKPFVLPQKAPEFYNFYLKSFNVPEFSTFKVKRNPGDLRKVVTGKSLQSGWKNK